MMTSVAVGLRYMLNSNLFSLFWIVMSRKLIRLSISFSKVNYIKRFNQSYSEIRVQKQKNDTVIHCPIHTDFGDSGY